MKPSDYTALAAKMGLGAPMVPMLWQRALTHRSVGERAESYERLEFLGDRVLALVLADWLLELFPNDEEGALAVRLAGLAREDTLAKVAAEWQLASHVVMGASLRGDGGVKASVLADCVEALLAVVWREQGYAAVQALVRRTWAPWVEQVGSKDAKTALQEWVQTGGGALPTYTVVREEGPEHGKIFFVDVQAAGQRAEGQGASKKEAEQAAAAALLEVLA